MLINICFPGNAQMSVKFHTEFVAIISRIYVGLITALSSFGFSTYVTTYDDVRQVDNTVKVTVCCPVCPVETTTNLCYAAR